MVDAPAAPRPALLDRPFRDFFDALADGDLSVGDGCLAAVTAAASAGRLVATCTELTDRPECAPRILELASLLAHARYLRQRLSTLVGEVASAEVSLADAAGLPSQDARFAAARRSAIQVALKRVVDRRLGVAFIAADLIRLAQAAEQIGAPSTTQTWLSETLASTALTSMLDAVEREVERVEQELDGAEASWLRAYIASEMHRLRQDENALLPRRSGIKNSRG